MPSEAGFVFKGDAAQFFQETAKMVTEWKKFQDEIKKTTSESNKLTEEEKTLAREGKKALEEIRGPQEQYGRRMKALNDLLREGKINQQEFGEAAKRSQVNLEGLGTAGEKAFGMAKQVVGALGIPLGIAGAVYAVKAAYGEWASAMQEAGRVSSEFHAQVIKDLAEAGELARGEEVTKFVGSISGVKREDALTAYAAIQQAAPGLSYERRKYLTAAIAPGAVTGIDMEKLGTLVGELAEMAPGKTAGDVADLALGLQQTAGREGVGLTRLGSMGGGFLKYVRQQVAEGKPLEEVLAEGLLAKQAGLDPKDFADLPSEQQARKAGIAEQWRKDQRTDLFSRQRRLLGTYAEGREKIEEYEAEAEETSTDEAEGLKWSAWTTRQKQIKLMHKRRGIPGPLNVIRGWLDKANAVLRGPGADRAEEEEAVKLEREWRNSPMWTKVPADKGTAGADLSAAARDLRAAARELQGAARERPQRPVQVES